MAVISVTITQSTEEIVSGIPRYVTIAVNIPSNIFYTFDGTDPTIFSNIYVGPLALPGRSPLVLKVFATNGVDSSSIISEVYQTDILNNARLAHSSTDDPVNNPKSGILFPFGSNYVNPNQSLFFNPGNSGIDGYNPALPAYSSGYGGDGSPNRYSNLPYNSENYDIRYSTTNAIGETGRGIGTLPGNVTIEYQTAPSEETFTGDKLFDPRAMVIFQDVANEDMSLPPILNRHYFSLEDKTKNANIAKYYIAGQDNPGTTGSFLRQHYNPRNSTMTYYYFDSKVNKWIISTAPHTPNKNLASLAGFVLSKSSGAGFVFEWKPFQRRHLF